MSDDLRLWLSKLGLEQHAETFAANDIELDLLPDLSDEDLKELGLSLGHRRRLLRAIARLSSERVSPAIEPAAPSDAAAVRQAERRQLTVLFCDLVGSTELSARHDPEDLRELLGRYHDAMTAVIQRYGGYVPNYLAHRRLADFCRPPPHVDQQAPPVP